MPILTVTLAATKLFAIIMFVHEGFFTVQANMDVSPTPVRIILPTNVSMVKILAMLPLSITRSVTEHLTISIFIYKLLPTLLADSRFRRS